MGIKGLKRCRLEDHPRVKDILNKKFNQLTAIEFIGIRNHAAVWRFACSCGCKSEVNAVGSEVTWGNKKTCSRSRGRRAAARLQYAKVSARYLKDAAAGMSGSAIARKYGVTPWAVNKCLKLHADELEKLKKARKK